MALVRKKGSIHWWLDITVPKELQRLYGPRIRCTTGTTDKAAANELHDKRKHELWAEAKLGERPKYTLKQAIEKWERKAGEKKMRSLADTKRQLIWWAEKLGPSTPLDSIKRKHIEDAVEGMMSTPTRKGEKPRPVKPATVNRYLAAIRMLLRSAVKWEMLDVAPHVELSQEVGRVRALKPEEIQGLRDALPEHWRDPYVFALATGMRADNVITLRPDQADLARRRLLVGSDDFKNGEDFGIPLNATAVAILERNLGKHKEAVFTYRGKPLKALSSRTWKAALAKAGIENFRWHDLRHTFATTFLENGGDLDQLQKLGGWKDRAMVMRYAHFRTDHLRAGASILDKAFGGLAATNPL